MLKYHHYFIGLKLLPDKVNNAIITKEAALVNRSPAVFQKKTAHGKEKPCAEEYPSGKSPY